MDILDKAEAALKNALLRVPFIRRAVDYYNSIQTHMVCRLSLVLQKIFTLGLTPTLTLLGALLSCINQFNAQRRSVNHKK